MKLKTIERVIHQKIREWALTLPKELQQPALDNVIVTGGCIASMFLQEKVNDFDLYFKDVEVLRKVCEHYLQRANEVNKDAALVLLDASEKEEVDKALSLKNIKQEDVHRLNAKIIALANLEIDQIKFFSEKYHGAGAAINEQSHNGNETYLIEFISPNAISLSDDIQIVNRFHGDPDEIHKNFDFAHATNYWTRNSGIVTNNLALECLLTKELKYIGSKYPLTSVIRIKKFVKRNYTINAGEMLKIMFQISELDLKDPFVLEEQLIGVDVAYFSTLIRIIQNSDDKVITSHFLNGLIDKVFSYRVNDGFELHKEDTYTENEDSISTEDLPF